MHEACCDCKLAPEKIAVISAAVSNSPDDADIRQIAEKAGCRVSEVMTVMLHMARGHPLAEDDV